MHIFTKPAFAAALIMLALTVASPTAATAAGIGHSFFMRGSVVGMENGTPSICIGKADGAKVGQVLDAVRVTTGQGTKGVPAFRREDIGSKRLPLSQRDNEGGAGRCGPKESTAGLAPSSIPVLTNTTAFARSRQSSI